MIAEQEAPAIVAARLPGDIADALAELVAQAKDSVVQVRSGRRGSGSGIIWRADGTLMTNYHVVGNRERAEVLLADNRELGARVIARDPILDLAALKVDAVGLPTTAIGQSQAIRVGELVLAIGSPWGQRGVVTAGIVSGVGEIEVAWRRGTAEYIRSDVRLAPGNSGGPMLDARGGVIGVNAMIFGGDLGVAIPSHIATQFLAVAEGQRPVLGVGVQIVELPPALRAQRRRERALLVMSVQPGSAAEQGGLYLGDVLLDIGGRAVEDAHSLMYALAQQPAGSELAVRLIRGGVEQTASVQLGVPDLVQAAA